MPTATITIDDVNPLITYRGAWRAGGNDAATNSYHDQTFTLCTDSGATAIFAFNGTGITLYGSNWFNHNSYNVTLDGNILQKDGYAADRTLNVSLFTISNLDNNLHIITLTNAGTNMDRTNDYLDLDFITWETTYGMESEQANWISIPASDPSFSYQPQGVWDAGEYAGSEGYVTRTFSAYATLIFIGQAVKIYGTIGQNSAPYGVQIDGRSDWVYYNATKQANFPQMLLYYADNLGAVQHSLRIMHESTTGNLSLFINYAQVDTSGTTSTASAMITGSSTSTAMVSSTSTLVHSVSRSSGLGGGGTAGIAIGVLAFIGIAGIFIWRWKHRQLSEKQARQQVSNITPYVAPHNSTTTTTTHANSHQRTNGVQNHRGESSYLVRNLKSAPMQSPSVVAESSTGLLQNFGHVSIDEQMPPPDYDHVVESSPF